VFSNAVHFHRWSTFKGLVHITNNMKGPEMARDWLKAVMAELEVDCEIEVNEKGSEGGGSSQCSENSEESS